MGPFFAPCRHGLPRRRLPDAGKPIAPTRQPALGHLFDPEREEYPWAVAACPDRVLRTAGRHSSRVLPRHASRDRCLDAADAARTTERAEPAGCGSVRLTRTFPLSFR